MKHKGVFIFSSKSLYSVKKILNSFQNDKINLKKKQPKTKQNKPFISWVSSEILKDKLRFVQEKRTKRILFDMYVSRCYEKRYEQSPWQRRGADGSILRHVRWTDSLGVFWILFRTCHCCHFWQEIVWNLATETLFSHWLPCKWHVQLRDFIIVKDMQKNREQ